MTYNELNSPMASSAFDFLSDIKSLCEGKVSDTKVDVDAKSMTKNKGSCKAIWSFCSWYN